MVLIEVNIFIRAGKKRGGNIRKGHDMEEGKKVGKKRQDHCPWGEAR